MVMGDETAAIPLCTQQSTEQDGRETKASACGLCCRATRSGHSLTTWSVLALPALSHGPVVQQSQPGKGARQPELPRLSSFISISYLY